MKPKRKKTMTQKQIEANRRNAQKSTGPKTPEGKLRSAMNATTHGLTAKSLVFENDGNERLEDFITLQAELQTDLQPVGRCEQGLVQRIAICHWRLNRAYRFEAAAVADERAIAAASSASLDEDDGHVPLDPASIVLPNSADLERLIRYEGLIDRELNRTMTQLDRLRTFRLKKEQNDEPEDDDAEDLDLTAALTQMAHLQSQFPLQPPASRKESDSVAAAQTTPAVAGGGRPGAVAAAPRGDRPGAILVPNSHSAASPQISNLKSQNSSSPSVNRKSEIALPQSPEQGRGGNRPSHSNSQSAIRNSQSPPAHVKPNPSAPASNPDDTPKPPTPRRTWRPPAG